MIIGYARCSTAGQRESIETQVQYLRKKFNAEIIYSELASGKNAERPELKKMLEYSRSGDTIVVQRLDRLARSVSDLIKIVNNLSSRNIDLISGHETIDTSTAAGKLIFHIFCSLAEFEASLTRERTLIGLDNARRNGRTGGRPRKLNREDVCMIQAIKESNSVSVRKLAKRYGIAPSTMYAYLKESNTSGAS